MGVSDSPCPEPGFAASQSVNKKRKVEVAKNLATKKAKDGSGWAYSSRVVPPSPKAGLTKKVSVLKISHPKARPGLRGMSVIELALMKPLGVFKKFHLLDVADSSQACTTGITMTHTTRVSAFDNLSDDSSPDVCEAPSPGATMEKLASPPPLASGEFLRFNFAILTVGLDELFLQTLPGLHLCRIFRWRT
jgi:hypothetical protein